MLLGIGVVMMVDMNTSRLFEIDFARGLALIIMIFAHIDGMVNPYALFGEGLGGTYPEVVNTYSFVARLIQTPTVVMFFILAGMSIGVVVYRSRRNGIPVPNLWRRGLVLLGLQLTIVSLGWYLLYGGNATITVGVLAGFAGAFVVMYFLRDIPVWTVGVVGVGMLIVQNAVMQAYTPTGYLMWDIIVRTLWSPGNLGGWANWYYPVYAWTAIVMIGYVLGYAYMRLVDLKKMQSVYIWLVSGVLLGLWVYLRMYLQWGNFSDNNWNNIYQLFLPSKYPPGISFVSLGLGTGLMWLAMGRMQIIQKYGGFVSAMGRRSLWVYCTHILCIALVWQWGVQYIPVSSTFDMFTLSLLATMGVSMVSYYSYDWWRRIWQSR